MGRRRPLNFATACLAAAVFVAVGVVGIDEAHGATTVPVPASIDGTGRTDVTNELNAFIDGLAPNTTVVFARNARYRVEGVLTVLKQSDLTFDGNGATIFATTDGSGVFPPRGGFKNHWPRRREQWDVRLSFNITFRNLIVRGANPHGGATPEAYVPALEGQAGFGISKSAGIFFESVTITDTYGDFVWIAGGTAYVTIRNSTLARSGRQGVAVVNGFGILVENNDIRDVGRSVFDLEPLGRAVAQDIHFQRNRIGNFRNFLLVAGGGGPGVNDVWLEDNRVDGGNGVSVAAGHTIRTRSGYHILNNTGTGFTKPPAGAVRPGLIQLVNLDGVEIRGNTQGVDGVPAISTDRVCNLTVTGNRFPGASEEQLEQVPCGGLPPVP